MRQVRIPLVEVDVGGGVEQREEQWHAGGEEQDAKDNIADDLFSVHVRLCVQLARYCEVLRKSSASRMVRGRNFRRLLQRS